MPKLLIHLLCLGLVLVLGPSFSNASPIGCEWHNDTVIKCWNNGSIENTTYYENNGQYYNYLDRKSWLNYEVGAFRQGFFFRTYFYLNFEVADMKFINNSDSYTVYYEYYAYYARRTIEMNYTHHQKVNDDYVTNNFYMDMFPTRLNDFYFFREFTDIDIGNDGDSNILNYYSNGEFASYNLSDPPISEPIEQYIQIADMDITGAVVAYLPMNYTLETSTDNALIYRPESWPINDTFYWIDFDPCSISAPRGCMYQYNRKIPYPGYGDNITIENKYIFRWYVRYTCASLMGCGVIPNGADCGPAISWGPGCYFELYEKNKTGAFNEIRDPWRTNFNSSCHNATYQECKKNSIYQGYTGYWEIEGHRNSNITVKACYKKDNDPNDCTDPLGNNIGQIVSPEYIIESRYDPCVPPQDIDWNVTVNLNCTDYNIMVDGNLNISKNFTYYNSTINFSTSSITEIWGKNIFSLYNTSFDLN